jgi:hypothetical protein
MSLVKFKNQNYEKIRSNCLSKVELYTDPEFTANHTSLFKSKRLNGIEWKRPHVSLKRFFLLLCKLKQKKI